MSEEIEDWEKDFTGLEHWLLTDIETAKIFTGTAKILNIRMEYKTVSAHSAELWVGEDEDLDELWNKLEGENGHAIVD